MMGAWVITVCGIAILSVLCDVILPDGQTKKYIKTVVGIVVTLVIVQPIFGIISSSANNIGISDVTIEVQRPVLDDINRRQNEIIAKQVNTLLNSNGIDVVNVSIKDGDVIELVLADKYSYDYEKKVKDILGLNFSNKKIIIIWKGQNEKN